MLIDPELKEKNPKSLRKRPMKKNEARAITITAERLSDKSQITFTISSDKTIEQLRALLNHHLPPLSPDKFDLYSYQRGALIHFHPSSFKLDYFPVIFDQSVLLLKMDDQVDMNNFRPTPKKDRKKSKYSILNDLFSSSRNEKNSSSSAQMKNDQLHRSSPVSCLTLLKQVFHQSSSTRLNTHSEGNVLSY